MRDDDLSVGDGQPESDRSIQILVENERNRELLADWLSEGYTVSAPTARSEFREKIDLCLIDEPSLGRYGDWIETLTETAHPEFLPVVLLSNDPTEEQLQSSGSGHTAGSSLIDEIVTVPVKKPILYHRIENLLERRALSLQLSGRLERTKERFRTLFNGTPDPVVVLSDDHEIQYVNDAFCHRIGGDRETLVGTPLTDVPGLSSGTAGAITEAADRHRSRGTARRPEITFTSPTGKRRYAEVNVSSIRSSKDDDAVVIMRDVTARHDRERELRSFKQAVEHSGHSIVITDVDGIIEYVNPAFEEVTGYSREEALGRTPRILKSGEHDEAFYEELWTTILDGNVWERELINERKDGEQFVVDQTISPITTDDGEIERFVAVNHDITNLKEYERELVKKTDQLAILSRVLRHDIRNDIQVVLPYTEFLEDLVDEDGQEYIEMIKNASQHVIELTKIARDISETIVEDSDELDLKPIDLASVVREEVAKRQDTTDEATVRVDGDVPSVTVLANEMLASVFRNLLNNAIQHNDSPTPEVRVSVEERPDVVRVRVADNGPGVPDDQKDRIFGQGERGLESEGTGMGLYLVHSLVTQFGGDVWVEDRDSPSGDRTQSDANEPSGAVFVVELPKATGPNGFE